MKNMTPFDEQAAARVAQKMRQEIERCHAISEEFAAHFRNLFPIHAVYLYPDGLARFRAYVFLERESDVARCREKNIDQEMNRYLFEKMSGLKLKDLGARTDGPLSIVIELDSHENVLSKYGGNYGHRLRS